MEHISIPIHGHGTGTTFRAYSHPGCRRTIPQWSPNQHPTSPKSRTSNDSHTNTCTHRCQLFSHDLAQQGTSIAINITDLNRHQHSHCVSLPVILVQLSTQL